MQVAPVARAVTYTVWTKADNTIALNASGSWSGTTADPGTSTDEALFDGTISATSLSSAIDTGSFTVGLLSFANNLNGAVTLNTGSGKTFTLGGNAGDIIDMTQANQDVTLNGSGFLRLGQLTGQQNFDVPRGARSPSTSQASRAKATATRSGWSAAGISSSIRMSCPLRPPRSGWILVQARSVAARPPVRSARRT